MSVDRPEGTGASRGAVIVAAMALLGLACGWGAPSARAAAKPNFVVIVTDDLDSSSLQFMPLTLQAVGNQGVRFDRYFAATSLCSPSRAAMLTGRYPHNTGIQHNVAPDGGYWGFRDRGHEANALPVWLQEAGYRTGLVGKYLNGYPGTAGSTAIPPGWSYWAGRIEWSPSHPHRNYDYDLNVNGTVRHYGTAETAHATDVYAGLAASFIRDSVAAQEPFFLWLAVHAPHQSAWPATRHRSLFPSLGVPRTPGFAEPDTTDKPSFIASLRLSSTQIQTLDQHYRDRVRALQAVDEAVRTLRDTLQATGKLANTYLMFLSDNGFHMGQHNLHFNYPIDKRLGYEEDIRVPLLVRGPGVRRNAVDAATLVANIDIAPTLAALAGVAVPTEVDGRSFAPWLAAAGSTGLPAARQSLQLELVKAPSQTGIPVPDFKGVRTLQYTWIEWADGQRELYDNAADPHQLTNLAKRSATRTLRAKLSTVTAALSACRGDGCRTLENTPLAELP